MSPKPMSPKPKKRSGGLSLQLGNNIATYRKVNNQTQKTLAQAVGVDKETISRFERGASLPSLQTLERLGEKLAVPLTALIGESSVQADDMAVNLTKILSELDEKDRICIYDVVKDLAAHFKKRGPLIEKRKEPRPRPQ